MNKTIFLSFSLPQSEYVATYFRDQILPTVFGGAFQFFLSRDIIDGSIGYAVIVEKCKEAVAGISFLTRENIYRPWINFEAGVMLGSLLSSKHLSLVLIGIDSEDFQKSPLLQLQYTRLDDRASVEKMFIEIYKSIDPTDHRYIERIKLTVNNHWKEWTEHLSRMPSAEPTSLEYELLGRKTGEFGILSILGRGCSG